MLPTKSSIKILNRFSGRRNKIKRYQKHHCFVAHRVKKKDKFSGFF